MKYLLPLLLLAGLANAGEEPLKEKQIYLYILMNGERNKIKAFKTEYATRDKCLKAIHYSKQGGHTRAVIYCGTNQSSMNKGLRNGREN